MSNHKGILIIVIILAVFAYMAWHQTRGIPSESTQEQMKQEYYEEKAAEEDMVEDDIIYEDID